MSVLKVDVRPLGVDRTSIFAAAQTVSLAFATDPLILWLARDASAPGWETFSPTLQQWQEARLREYACRGIAMEAVAKEQHVGTCFLFPPKPQHRWVDPSWWPTYLRIAWDKYWVKPIEPVGDEARVNLMFGIHFSTADQLKKKYAPNSLWYLEIAAVHPECQGMGVGGKMMNWVVDRLGDAPCYLECTNIKNVPFYEKYGFNVVDEKVLCQHPNGEGTTFYYMIRDKSRVDSRYNSA